jgi:ribosomal protein L37AE/L43A
MPLHDCACGGMSPNCTRCGGDGMVSTQNGASDTNKLGASAAPVFPVPAAVSGLLPAAFFVPSPHAIKPVHPLSGARWKPEPPRTIPKGLGHRKKRKRKSKTLAPAGSGTRLLRPEARQLVPCPHCSSPVRRDRLQTHLWRVHRGRRLPQVPAIQGQAGGGQQSVGKKKTPPLAREPVKTAIRAKQAKGWELVRPDSESIKKYWQRCYSRSQQRYECEFCGATFLKPVGLRLHFNYCDDVPIVLIGTLLDAQNPRRRSR